MNWGYGILIVILLFITGMGFMLSVAMKQKIEMVDDNYYSKELLFQSQIDATNNLNALSEPLSVVITDKSIVLKIPAQARNKTVSGNVIFLRSSDQRLDKNFPLVLNENGEQLLPATNFVRGQYTLRVSWKSADKPYYYEERINAL